MKVLVVDDNELFLQVSEAALSASGFDVVTSGSALGFSTALAEARPHVALIDVLMPAINGNHLVEIARPHGAPGERLRQPFGVRGIGARHVVQSPRSPQPVFVHGYRSQPAFVYVRTRAVASARYAPVGGATRRDCAPYWAVVVAGWRLRTQYSTTASTRTAISSTSASCI